MNLIHTAWGCRLIPLLPMIAIVGIGACDSNGGYPVRPDAATASIGDGGSIQITGTTNHCPTVALTVSPPDASVGGHVSLGVGASDPDLDNILTYAWTAGAGTFGDAKAPYTTYTCSSAGPQELTIAVSDGQCTATTMVTVYCFAIPGGGGTGGVAAGTSGGAGTGGRSGSGGSGGSTAGTGGMNGSGGATGTGGTAMCTGDPTMDQGDTCNQCTADNCVSGTDGCSLELLGSDAKRQACLNLYCCMRASRCIGENADPLPCWCGKGVNGNLCTTMPGVAAGPCLHEVEAAAESTVPMTIKQRFPDPAFAVGGATNLLACRANFCTLECNVSVSSN